MKKLHTFMLAAFAAITAVGFTACNDDDDVPDVTMGITIDGGVFDTDGVIYVVQGDTLNVTSVDVKNNEAGKPATIAYATYYWNYNLIGSTNIVPFGAKCLTTEFTPVGNYRLEIICPVLALDKELMQAVMNYTVKVVPDAADLPDGTVQQHTAAPTVTK